MSNITAPRQYPIDMSQKEKESLDAYIEAGLPFIKDLTEEKMKAAVEMYLNGSTYQEISVKLGIKKNMFMFIAYKHGLYETKMAIYEDLMTKLQSKVELAHLKSFNFLTDLMGSLESYYAEIVNRYAITKDKRVLETADFENLKIYMKCMESIQKFRNPDENKKPGFGLNLPNGGTLRKIDDNTVEVSPLSSPAAGAKLGDILKTLAELREKRETEDKGKT